MTLDGKILRGLFEHERSKPNITSTKIQQKAITSAIIIKILNDNIFRYTFSNTNQHIGKLNIFPYT